MQTRSPIVIAMMLLSLTFANSASTAVEQGRGPSTPEERARVVKIAHLLEANPLSKELKAEREWALRWLIEVPDISITLCSKLPDVSALGKYKYRGELIVQSTLSQAAFVIENPDMAKDLAAASLAGMESVLRSYKAILNENPKATSKYLDEMLDKRNREELAGFVKELAAGCK